LETTISEIEAQFVGTDDILRQYMKNNNILSDHLPSFISKFAKAIIKADSLIHQIFTSKRK
jgi:hypothetical protein